MYLDSELAIVILWEFKMYKNLFYDNKIIWGYVYFVDNKSAYFYDVWYTFDTQLYTFHNGQNISWPTITAFHKIP